MTLMEKVTRYRFENAVRLAVFSPCRRYRYLLSRHWDTNRAPLCIIGLNPSLADASRIDPTVRRCLQYAADWGYGGLKLVNLFAYRSPYPQVLRRYYQPVGPENDWYLDQAISQSGMVVCAWGNQGQLRRRDQRVLPRIAQPYCLKQNASGAPAHPLYQRRDARPVPLRYP